MPFGLNHPDKVKKYYSEVAARDCLPEDPTGKYNYKVLRSSRPPCFILAQYQEDQLVGYEEE